MMNEAIYQKIYEELNKYLMPKWEKLVVYLEYGNASYSFSFFVKKGKEYIKCYDLLGVSEEALAQSFKKIDVFVSKERDKAKDKWSNMTMIVECDGTMHTDYDYTDLSEGTYQFKKMWKQKYLK